MIRTSWATRHGDTEHSKVWAVVDDHGQPVDLTVWAVRAQMRRDYSSVLPDYSFTVGNGIALGQATLVVGGRPVTTSTVQLYLNPVDWATIPNPYTGVLDIEMASDSTTSPGEVHTLVEARFTADQDVTRI